MSTARRPRGLTRRQFVQAGAAAATAGAAALGAPAAPRNTPPNLQINITPHPRRSKLNDQPGFLGKLLTKLGNGLDNTDLIKARRVQPV